MSKSKILIVEDDQFLVKIYQTKLESEGFDIELALDGEEGIEKAGKFMPELILLDLILPKMNGFEVLKKLKTDEKTKNIPVIVLSNLGQESDVKQGMELGAVNYLIKSDHSINEIIDKIKKELEKK
ncbi:MAG: response regulator [Patescibacteria group bacterium]|nr:response regulator [Patescibacteria group bacterium]